MPLRNQPKGQLVSFGPPEGIMKKQINDLAPLRRSMSWLADLPPFPAGEHPRITHRIRISVHRVACAGTPLFGEITTPAVHRGNPL
jgi:hypothetical protein